MATTDAAPRREMRAEATVRDGDEAGHAGEGDGRIAAPVQPRWDRAAWGVYGMRGEDSIGGCAMTERAGGEAYRFRYSSSHRSSR